SWLDNRKLQPVPTPQLSVAPIWREISAQAGSPVSSAYIVCNLNVALLLLALVSRSVVSFWLAASVNVHRSCVWNAAACVLTLRVLTPVATSSVPLVRTTI